jgi:O-glycosyl hydrolase/alpha-tubulin suppressor-like RCC1 family protein
MERVAVVGRRIGGVGAVLAAGVLLVMVAAVPAVPARAGGTTQTNPAASEGSPSTSSSNFQITIASQTFPETLPTSSVATYVLPPGSSTLSSTETATKSTKLNPKIELASQPAISAGPAKPSLPQITVDPSTTFQSITGFGGAMTDSSAYLINHSPDKGAILNALFGSSGGQGEANADFNMVRLPLGASDFVANSSPSCPKGQTPTCYAPPAQCDKVGATASASCFQSYDDTDNDPLLSDLSTNHPNNDPNFSIGNDGPDTIPVLESVKSMVPNLKIVALPWSPPGWMKVSGRFLTNCASNGSDPPNGNLNDGDEAAFAAYLTRAAQDYQSQGLPFSMLSIQNEPQNCRSSYPTMTMTPTEQAAVASDLASDFMAAGLSPVPQIMGYDHNWYSPGEGTTTCFNNSTYGPTDYPEQLLAAPGGTDVQDIGFHSYCGDSSVQGTLSSDDPGIGTYVTESTGTFDKKYSAAQDLVNEIKGDLIDPIRNGADGSLYWNLALDQNCGPQFSGSTKACPASEKKYSGCTNCRPFVTVNTQNTSKSPSDAVCFDGNAYCLNQDYYYWAQFSKFVQPGAVRINSSTIGSLDTVAFQNPSVSSGGNGDIVVVVLSGSTPTIYPALGVVKSMVTDGTGYCAVLLAGEVKCWGSNDLGQLGNGTYGGPACSGGDNCYDTAQSVSGISDAVSIATDDGGYCAVLSTGGVDCWGNGDSGQLGTGGEASSDVPEAVVGVNGVGTLGGVVSLSSDGNQFGYCALLISGAADCWGDNSYGELGNGTEGGPVEETDYDTPQAVAGLTDATAIIGGTVGDYCAVLSTGGVSCWGSDDEGQLGNGTESNPSSPSGNPDYDTPQSVIGISSATSVTGDSGGAYCALLSSGEVECWGPNSRGEIGNGTINGPDVDPGANDYGYDTPQAVLDVSSAVSLASTGDGTFCAVLSDGTADCWGFASFGELGNGTTQGAESCEDVYQSCFDSPQPVSDLTNAQSLSTSIGEGTYCAVLSTGGVDCWGDNGVGQLGLGLIGGPDEADGYDTPQSINGMDNASAVVGNENDPNYCTVLSSGEAECWGYNPQGDLGNGSIDGPDGEGGYASPQIVVTSP